MKKFLGIFFAVTQGTKKGETVCAFDVCSDGLFTAPDLGKLGLEHLRFKDLFSYWTYSTLDTGDIEDQEDPYGEKYQILQQFNDHYKNNFEHGWKVMVDEQIFWAWERDQPGECHNVDRKPRGFGPEYKCLSAVGVQVTTTFQNVRRKKVNDYMKYNR